MILKIFTGIFLLCQVSSVFSNDPLKVDPECVKPWVIVGDMCVLVQTKFRTWQRAEFYCKIFHGDLIYIENEQEQLALESYLDTLLKDRPTTEDYFWIGATNQNDNQTWRWTKNDQLVEYANWHATLHNRYTSQHQNAHCAGVMFNDLTWRDANCEETAQFICRRDFVRTTTPADDQKPKIKQVVDSLVSVSENEINRILETFLSHKPTVVKQPLVEEQRVVVQKITQPVAEPRVVQPHVAQQLAPPAELKTIISYEEVTLDDQSEAKSILKTLFSPIPVLKSQAILQKSTTQKMQFIHHDTKVVDQLLDEHLLSDYDDSDVIAMPDNKQPAVAQEQKADTINEDEHILKIVQNITLLDFLTVLNDFNATLPVEHTVQETWKVPSNDPNAPAIVIQTKTVTDEKTVEELIEHMPPRDGNSVTATATEQEQPIESAAVVAAGDEVSSNKQASDSNDVKLHFGSSDGHAGHQKADDKPHAHDNNLQPVLKLEPSTTPTPAFVIPPRFNFKPNPKSQSLTDASNSLSGYSLSIVMVMLVNMIVQHFIQ